MQDEGGDDWEYLKVSKNIGKLNIVQRYLLQVVGYQRYFQVGDSDQWFVLLGRSGSHYTLYSTQVSTVPTESNKVTFHFQSTGVFSMKKLREVVYVELWGLQVEEVEGEEVGGEGEQERFEELDN